MKPRHNAKARSMPLRRRLAGFAVVGLLALFALWFGASCVSDIGIATRQQIASGAVVSVTPLKDPSSRSGHPNRADRYVVRYRYAVQGKTYERSVVRSTAATAQAPVNVYYDRDDPTRSSLEDFEAVSHRSRTALILMAVGIAVFGLVIWSRSGRVKLRN